MSTNVASRHLGHNWAEGTYATGKRAQFCGFRAVSDRQKNSVLFEGFLEPVEISCINTKTFRLDVDAVALFAVVERAIEAVRPLAEARGFLLHAVLDACVGSILGDCSRLQQMLWNLLTNAVKFTRSAGQVQVRLSRTESYVEFVAKDTGEVVAPDVLPHVFERLRQEQEGSNRLRGGLRLGLTIVKHLVELHGEAIQALSEGKGTGATFVMRIPSASFRNRDMPVSGFPATMRPFAEGACVLPELEGLRVLVVHDEQDARDQVAAVIEQCGATAETVANADKAFELLRTTRPDVLVSNIGTPDEDSYSLIQKVRALPDCQGGRTPAVALTAYARMEDRARMFLAGFTIHVPKPIEPAELLVVLANVSGRLSKVPGE
jgi:CheY-like chemotaxis protein